MADDEEKITTTELIMKLGQGAHGGVYLVQTKGEKKVWKEFRGVEDKVLNRTFSIPVQQQLRHENIMGFKLRCVIAKGVEVKFLEMELANESLKETINRAKREKKQLNEGLVTKTVLNILNAVSCAHSKSIMHRDLKPSNILMFFDEDGGFLRAKVTDFGMCRLYAGEEKLMSTDVGTIGYKAPEINIGAYSYSVDIYSCGKILEDLLEHLEDCPGKPRLTKLAKWMTRNDPQYRPSPYWAKMLLLGEFDLTDEMITHTTRLEKEEKLRILREQVIRLENDIARASSNSPVPSSGSANDWNTSTPPRECSSENPILPNYLVPFLSSSSSLSSSSPTPTTTPSSLSNSQQ